jgi:O-antigen/teichoic acid export membrane protein
LVGAALTVVLLKMGYGLLALALLTLGQTVVADAVRAMVRKRIVPEVKYRLKYIKKARIKEMLGYGWISFLIVVATMTIFNTDNIIIGIFESSAAVTFYSIAGTLINYLRVIAGSVGVPLTPVISHLDSSDGAAKIGPLYASMVSKLHYLFTALSVSILVFGDSFIYLWMGPEFGSTVKVLFILIIPASIYLPQVLANSVLLGIGRHKPLMYVLMVEAVGNIALSLILVQIWGIYGVAWGTAIPQIVIYTVVYPVVFHKIIKGSLSEFYMCALKMMAIATAFALPPALLMQAYNNVPGWPGFILNVFVVGAFIGIGFWYLVLDTNNRAKVMAKIRR